MSKDEDLEFLRAEISKAQADLHTAQEQMDNLLRSLCPGPHAYTQHRDRRPPWCDKCRRTAYGTEIPKRSDS